MHGMANATFNLLSLLPEFVGQMMTFWLFLARLGLITFAAITIFGPAKLVRL